ncbi:hypothetical protein IV487_01000 [Enterococcus saccharolyticus]|uniref:Lipoprotein n=1 Tax=Candidatus Enterococcus willemsii TaxID=1857215 RepID=A0ABQ6Z1N2_9ENTE|nr:MULTISPECIES: hypothetical protein [Enterococcus]KAF1305408.1 hypothetical protein BAU17_02645 [Enterococcus sp. CU12B]MCD5001054.1 hypothetical protein [Enterococcus saccharolyticus]
MKKICVLFLVGMMLGACSNRSNESPLQQSIPSETNVNDTSNVSKQTIDSSIVLDSQSSEEANPFPYAVNVDDLAAVEDKGGAYPISVKHTEFVAEGINIPNKITLDQAIIYVTERALYIQDSQPEKGISENHSTMYIVSIDTIPTKEITLFGGIGSDENKRTVKVNTRLTLHSFDSFEDVNNTLPIFDKDEYYLFYNKQGTVSLATRNFAGNVEMENRDTMLEYVRK